MRISRRGFVKLVLGGAAAAVAGLVALLTGAVPGGGALRSLSTPAPKSQNIAFSVNGAAAALEVKSNSTLLSVLRDDLKMTGTKPGCSNSECGACTVLLDGTPVYSCHKLAVEADGHSVTTIEGLSAEGLSALQQAFVDEGGFQCGFCTSGFIVAGTALLKSNPSPTEQQVKQALSGNSAAAVATLTATKRTWPPPREGELQRRARSSGRGYRMYARSRR